ncbi:preprotein translocase subunit YajC [Microbacterium sp. SSM24]|uniref:preprotein translocase subunit YajC n=1 Tax=Microbacterium sp. SSM24 TaxID=2991714 RepID=UPI0022278874|nr:preprotein translocase subunit YajC [Microbacterium sp. SSM24]MCW3494535.1 preprotein translocase subunit YajC [Microbacterium sp. SSM24]
MNEFFTNYGLIILLVVLLVFMFWSSRRRMAKQKLEQEQRARQTVPGAEVLLQGGLFGTIVSYDPENLDQPAIVEIAPGVEIKVHSQAILRVVDPAVEVQTEDDFLPEASAPVVTPVDDVADDIRAVDDKADAADPDAEPGTKPQA